MSDLISIKRALLSVSDKTDLVPLAEKLCRYDVEIISTGGTARALKSSGISSTDVAEITGFPEIMGEGKNASSENSWRSFRKKRR